MLQGMAAQGITPQALKNRPSLKPHLRVYYEGFWRLSKGRPRDMGYPQRLALRDVLSLADEMMIEGEQRDHFCTHMEAMDDAYFVIVDKKAEADRKRKG